MQVSEETRLLNELKKEIIKVFPLNLNIKKHYQSICVKFFPFGFSEKASEFFIYFASLPAPSSIQLVCDDLQYKEVITKTGDLKELTLEIKKSFINMLREFSERVLVEAKKLEDNFNGIETNDAADKYMLAHQFAANMSASDFNARLKTLGGDVSNYEISQKIYTNIKKNKVLLYSLITSKTINEEIKKQAREFALREWIKLEFHHKYFWWAMKQAAETDSSLVPETLNTIHENNIVGKFSFPEVTRIACVNNIGNFNNVKKKFPNLEKIDTYSINAKKNLYGLFRQIANDRVEVGKIEIRFKHNDMLDEELFRETLKAGVFAKSNKMKLSYYGFSREKKDFIQRLQSETEKVLRGLQSRSVY